MNFLTVTQEEKLADMIAHIYMRELEIYQYQNNIDNYTRMLASLPSSWPEELMQYKNAPDDLSTVPLNLIETVSNIRLAERLSTLIRTEMIEQGKCKHIYNSLVSQLPLNFDLASALLAEKQKQTTTANT